MDYQGLTMKLECTIKQRIHTEYHPCHLGATCPNQPGQPDDLARVDSE